MQLISGLHAFIVTVRSFLIREFSSTKKVGILGRLKALTKGFYSESYILYDLHNRKIKDFLPDFARFRSRFINSDYTILLKDKQLFQTVIGHFVDVPNTIGVTQGKIISKGSKTTTVDEVIDIASNSGGVIIKPQRGSGGYNIMLLSADGDKLYLNKKEISRAEINDVFARLNKYIVSEFVKQGDYAAKIFPHSTNTMRILTMVDPETQKPFIPIAVHRFGVRNTIPVDNWSQGGMSALVDMETGILGRAVRYSPEENKMVWFDVHPETKAPIQGVRIPNWETIKDTLIEIVENLPSLKYVGWDVVSTNSGLQVIEGNSFTDIDVLQVHQGLLADPRVYKFYKHHRVIK